MGYKGLFRAVMPIYAKESQFMSKIATITLSLVSATID